MTACASYGRAGPLTFYNNIMHPEFDILKDLLSFYVERLQKDSELFEERFDNLPEDWKKPAMVKFKNKFAEATAADSDMGFLMRDGMLRSAKNQLLSSDVDNIVENYKTFLDRLASATELLIESTTNAYDDIGAFLNDDDPA